MLQQTDLLWQEVLAKIGRQVNGRQFETWFRRMRLMDVSDDSVTLGIPAAFYREWIEKHYLSLLQSSLNQVLERNVKIAFKLDAPEHKQLSFDWREARGRESAAEEETEEVPTVETIFEPLRLNERFVFEDFVVGPSNRLAYAAAIAAAESPGKVYNPLFIQGGVGLGKTHLLQAVCHAALKRDPAMKILFLSCEDFVNKFIIAIERGEVPFFREQCRGVDMLVIDDIHFLANKEHTQEEFFHTFNSLYNAQKQIVLSSDCLPNDMTSMEERVVSRFQWGMVANIEPPVFETRVAIAKRKASRRGRELPNDVLNYLAEKIETNIRELEGAVIKIIGYASLMKRPIDLTIAKEALRDVLQRNRRVRLEDVRDAVVEHFKVKASDLMSRSRSKSIAHPRQVCMYLARHLTECSLEEIGAFFGGRDHTTVLYAEDKIKEACNSIPDIKHDVEALSRKISRGA